MAFKDGGGSVSWTGFRTFATGATATVAVLPLSPSDGDKLPSAAVSMRFSVSNTGTGGTDVQLQVASDAGFTSIVASASPTALGNGPTVQVLSGLPTNQLLYWRTRGAPTGTTTWGPWSPSRRLTVDLNTGRGYGYGYVNVGIDSGLTYSGDTEYVFENVGFEVLPASRDLEYAFENVGFEVLLSSDDVEYGYEGDVNTDRPTPHVWFLWKKFGFANDEVWAYGHGFGNPQSEYFGQLKIDPGPDYTTADVVPPINEWYLQEAIVPDAYTDARKIYAGTDTVAPIVNQQCEIIRFVAPASIVPADAATTELIYVQHSGGASNKVGWLMYPTLPTSITNVSRAVSTTTSLRVARDYDGDGIEQLWFYAALPPYVISQGRPERQAAFSATAVASAELGTWDVEDDLADALAVNMYSTRRWLPDPAKVVARPDLGTGVSLWTPSSGSTTVSWKLRSDSEPYIDPAYSVLTRSGEKTMPAMIFPGDAFAELTAAVTTGPYFTIALVAVIQPPPNGLGTILSTFNSNVDPASYDWKLLFSGNLVRELVGGTLRQHKIESHEKRPVIIIASVGAKTTNLIVVDSNSSSTTGTHPPMQAAGNKLYMGRSPDPGDLMNLGAMDVLDVVFWDNGMTLPSMWRMANRLDGIYGVTG